MKYFSIDIETTGIDPEKHQILEVGAIFEDTDKQLSFDEIPKFHRILSPPSDIIGTPFALNMNQRILKILSSDKLCTENRVTTYDSFIKQFINWIKEVNNGNNKINCAGKNFAGFDKQFLEKNFPLFKSEIKISNRVLDPAILYAKLSDDSLPNTETCVKRAGIELNNFHYALDDSWTVIQLLRKKYHLL